MIVVTACGGRIVAVCPCGHHATGLQPQTVATALKDHEAFAHGAGISPETHAMLRAAYP